MPIQTAKRDLTVTVDTAREWINKCLVRDGSILSNEALWAKPLIAEVRRAFVDQPDAGDDTFLTKLKGQMKHASSASQRLMAEMLWALLLFPSNVGPESKRKQILETWALSGASLGSRKELTDDVLSGIGSGGPGYNNHRWRELAFLISLADSIKQRSDSQRQTIFTHYDSFVDWIESVPQEGHRQFRHMLRYFAFPQRVERMSSNRDRQRILDAYGVASRSATQRWTDRQLDEALQKLRSDLEKQFPNTVLDFYEQPLRARWNPDEPAAGEDKAATSELVHSERGPKRAQHDRPFNLILFGPPGTGKTHWVREKFEEYTDRPTDIDRETWLLELVRNFGWRSIIAVALDDLGRPSRVPDLRAHELISAKANQRGRSAHTVLAGLWAYLQTHTPESVSSVKYSNRRPPFIFSKHEGGEWGLLPDWRELDDESVELSDLWKAGHRAAEEPIRRYRVVTFHPSFTYEDFVRGIRPVATTEDGTTQFRTVDGVFKRICDEARANPAKRYALFIDEINRANIAKVFGELISLIEVDKRIKLDDAGRVTAGMEVQLPGSETADTTEPAFGVPANLDLFGTMNTADRSIALLDVALRRRFEFQEMEPDYTLLDRDVSGVDTSALLRRLNDRLEYLLDRDHRIGHAYLMPVHSLEDLKRVFRVQIIPLLQEYFFDDLSRVAAVLATTNAAAQMVGRRALMRTDVFPDRIENVPAERTLYFVTEAMTWTEQTFTGIYADSSMTTNAEEQD